MLNNDGYLQQCKERIYPKELVLNQENKDNRATFLDLEGHIKDGKFYIKTYDKREAFNFEIINYPDLSGNIPEWPAYGIYISQVIRYAKTCYQTKDFIDRIRLLFNKLRKKRFSKERLLAALKKCCRKNPWIMEKHCHRMNNHLANDCWDADTWSWYRDSSPETSVSVHGWRHPTTSINQLVIRYLVNLLVRIKEPSSPTGWQQSPQPQTEDTKKSRKLDCVATGFIYDDAVNFIVDVRLASHVRSVAPTVLVGSISYFYILSSNVRRCVVCKVSCKISKIEFFRQFFKFTTLTLSCFDLGSDVNHYSGVIMGRWGVSQNAGILVVLVMFCSSFHEKLVTLISTVRTLYISTYVFYNT